MGYNLLFFSSEVSCLQVRAPLYSGYCLQASYFRETTIASIFAYLKCIVSYYCLRENETWRQYLE